MSPPSNTQFALFTLVTDLLPQIARSARRRRPVDSRPMTAHARAAGLAEISAREAPSLSPSTPGMRVAIIDRDSGFIQVLSKRLESIECEHRVLASPVQPEQIASMRLAPIVNLAILGPQAWTWL